MGQIKVIRARLCQKTERDAAGDSIVTPSIHCPQLIGAHCFQRNFLKKGRCRNCLQRRLFHLPGGEGLANFGHRDIMGAALFRLK